VICERPKSGRTWESKTPRSKDVVLDPAGDQFDETANHIALRRQKHRKTRFNIVERFLVNRVGRNWDKVYAELCEVTDARSFQGAEIRDWAKRLVAIDCWTEERIVMSYDCSGCPAAVRGLYVHPKSRVLLRKE
jgi:hypothetical protein